MDLKASSFLKVPKYTYGAYHKVYTKHCLAEDHLLTYRQFQIQMDLKVPRYTCGTNHKVYTKYCPAEDHLPTYWTVPDDRSTRKPNQNKEYTHLQ